MMLLMSEDQLVGRALADRYRLVRPLAAGSSGRTWLAHDARLQRRVAVKILHAGLAGDRGFLERFRAEARVVASLSHPNVVTLHDWGEEPVPFMVFELLTGGSLAALLRTGTRLTPAQAARMGVQVVAALEHAHSKGLVHRDVKPGNLMFDEHGNVRVADFGLARALAAAGMTEPVGGIVGTARYAAPEQGSSVPVDARADLYALGLVLCEAVTGETPLLGDSPLATLQLRAAHPLAAPVELGPLGVAVERAALPYPVERFADAAAMGRALQAAAAMLPEPDPVPTVGLGVPLDEPDPTEMGTAHPAAPRSMGAGAGVGTEEPTILAPLRPTDPVEVSPHPRPPAPSSTRSRSGRWIPRVIVGAVVTALVASGFAVTRATTPLVHAPNLIGQTRDAGGASLNEAGLLLSVREEIHAPDPPGTIIAQTPEAGDALRRGGEISVVVSKGAPPVDLPDVAGQPAADAEQALRDVGFEVTVTREHDDTVEPDHVVAQSPSTRRAPQGSTVTLVVSDGPAPVVVPNVVGKSAEDAERILEDAGFSVERTEEFSDAVEEGLVIRQDPVSGAEAVPGTTSSIVVSKGPDRVLIPDARGLTVEEATRSIEGVGLEVDVVNYSPGGLVKKQDPEPGLMLERGRTVTLFV